MIFLSLFVIMFSALNADNHTKYAVDDSGFRPMHRAEQKRTDLRARARSIDMTALQESDPLKLMVINNFLRFSHALAKPEFLKTESSNAGHSTPHKPFITGTQLLAGAGMTGAAAIAAAKRYSNQPKKYFDPISFLTVAGSKWALGSLATCAAFLFWKYQIKGFLHSGCKAETQQLEESYKKQWSTFKTESEKKQAALRNELLTLIDTLTKKQVKAQKQQQAALEKMQSIVKTAAKEAKEALSQAEKLKREGRELNAEMQRELAKLENLSEATQEQQQAVAHLQAVAKKQQAHLTDDMQKLVAKCGELGTAVTQLAPQVAKARKIEKNPGQHKTQKPGFFARLLKRSPKETSGQGLGLQPSPAAVLNKHKPDLDEISAGMDDLVDPAKISAPGSKERKAEIAALQEATASITWHFDEEVSAAAPEAEKKQSAAQKADTGDKKGH